MTDREAHIEEPLRIVRFIGAGSGVGERAEGGPVVVKVHAQIRHDAVHFHAVEVPGVGRQIGKIEDRDHVAAWLALSRDFRRVVAKWQQRVIDDLNVRLVERANPDAHRTRGRASENRTVGDSRREQREDFIRDRVWPRGILRAHAADEGTCDEENGDCLDHALGMRLSV